jgi:hypothetical protein
VIVLLYILVRLLDLFICLFVGGGGGGGPLTVRERRDGALALSDIRLLLNQPPRKLGGSYYFCFVDTCLLLVMCLSQAPLLYGDLQLLVCILRG